MRLAWEGGTYSIVRSTVLSQIGDAIRCGIGVSVRQGAFATLHIEQPPGIGHDCSPSGQHGQLGAAGPSGQSGAGFEVG